MAGSTPVPGQLNQNLHLPPLRSLDDFIFGSARFQLPNLKDLEKWGNRVVKNLLYYQTNYILMFVTIYLVMAMINPVKIFWGLLVKALVVVFFVKFYPDRQIGHNKWIYMGGSLFVGYLILLWFDALLLSAFTLLLPFAATFVHSSLRLRNIRNKVVNTMESFGPVTPMGMFLDAMNITVDNMLS